MMDSFEENSPEDIKRQSSITDNLKDMLEKVDNNEISFNLKSEAPDKEVSTEK